MKNFNEWRAGVDEIENPDKLMEKLKTLAHELEVQLGAFQGNRFEGFLNIVGGVRNLQRAIAEVDNGCVGDGNKFTTESAIKPMKKIKKPEVVSKGVRKGEKDLSSDYKGHLSANGDVEPFKILKKK